MASTNGQKTLVDKITAIANAIRGKTLKTNQISMDDMVNEINNEWKIKCYVKELYINDDGVPEGEQNDEDWKYVDKNIGGRTNNGILLSYTPENDIMLTATTNDGGRENIIWAISSAPPGISIYGKNDWKQILPSGNSGSYQSCVIQGINQNCRIGVDIGETGGTKNIFTFNLIINYI